MDKKIENDVGYLWAFDYDNEEFERVREICLADTKITIIAIITAKDKNNKVIYKLYLKIRRV